MILFDQVIQVFDLPEFDRFGKDSRSFELGHGFGIGGILIDSDDAGSRLSGVGDSRSRGLFHLLLEWTSLRSRTSRGSQRLHKEAFGCLGMARRAQEKLQGV